MTFPELQSLLEGLIGEPVTRKTFAGNTILLWFKPELTQGFWIDPPWRLEVKGRIEATSAEIPWEKEEWESEEHFGARFEAACSQSDQLKGATLDSAVIEPGTSDLCLGFTNGRVLRTFVVWPNEENWHFSDYEAMRRYEVFPRGVEIKPLEPRSERSE